MVEKRKAIMARRCVDDEYIANWFSYEPVSKPAPRFQAKLAAIKSAPAKAQTRARGAGSRRS